MPSQTEGPAKSSHVSGFLNGATQRTEPESERAGSVSNNGLINFLPFNVITAEPARFYHLRHP